MPEMQNRQMSEGQARSVLDPSDGAMIEAMKSLIRRRMQNRLNASKMFQDQSETVNKQMRRGY